MFDFKTLCLICAESCDLIKEKKKPINIRRKIFEIRSLTVKDNMLGKAALRNDEWGQKVTFRIQGALCLVAEEARYHQDCYSRFASNPPTTKKKRGRSEDGSFASASFQWLIYLR